VDGENFSHALLASGISLSREGEKSNDQREPFNFSSGHKYVVDFPHLRLKITESLLWPESLKLLQPHYT